jgi:hypothetical protein
MWMKLKNPATRVLRPKQEKGQECQRSMKLTKSERNRYKKAAKQLLYSDWVQRALDKAQTEEEATRIMTTARKEGSKFWKDRN